MSYQVIARRWRPKSFTDLVGQDHVSQTLINALKNERLPHALLFTGPRGTGKTSSARILAMSLRCQKAKDFVPCGTCEDCNDIASGRSVDVIEIDGASNNGVDAIRELRDSVGYMPSSGRFKIYIIDEVHMLSTSAFNALLKTLEEPPDHVIFIMATTEAHKIPNTILSRVQRFDFRRIATRLITEWLQSICKKDKVNADEAALWMVARQGDGSMRDSQSLLDQVITYSDGKITTEKVIDVLGLTDRQLLLTTLDALVKRDRKVLLTVIEKIFVSGIDSKVFMQDLLEELRNLLMVKLCPDQTDRLVDLAQSEVDDLSDKATALSSEDIHLLFDMALKGANDLPRAQDPQVVLEMLLLRMAAAPRVESLMNLKNYTPRAAVHTPATVPARATSTSQNRQPAAPKTQSQPATAQQAPAEAPVPEAGEPEKRWQDLVGRIKKVNGLVAAKLEHSYLVQLNDKTVVIGIPPKMKFLYDQVNDKGFQKKLTNYMTTFWGPGFSIEIQLGDEKKSQHFTPKAIEASEKRKQEEDTRQQVENHPLVKSANKVFKTEIQSIKEIP